VRKIIYRVLLKHQVRFFLCYQVKKQDSRTESFIPEKIILMRSSREHPPGCRDDRAADAEDIGNDRDRRDEAPGLS